MKKTPPAARLLLNLQALAPKAEVFVEQLLHDVIDCHPERQQLRQREPTVAKSRLLAFFETLEQQAMHDSSLPQLAEILEKSLDNYALEQWLTLNPQSLETTLLRNLQKTLGADFSLKDNLQWSALFWRCWEIMQQIITQNQSQAHSVTLSQASRMPASRFGENPHQGYLHLFLDPAILEKANPFPEYTMLESQSALPAMGKKSLKIQVDLDFFSGHSQQTVAEILGKKHISLACQAQGRCTSCRVEVIEGLKNILPRNSKEEKIAKLYHWSPEIRLACQSYAQGNVRLQTLLPVDDERTRNLKANSARLAILFADIRGFTRFSEKHLPYDVIYILNIFYEKICEPIHSHGGYIDKFMGDGIMVLFGLDQRRSTHPCLDACLAAKGMLQALKEANVILQKDWQESFCLGIGIHYGNVVLGEVGFSLKRDFTALGDAVNTAARIEQHTRRDGSQILVSEKVAARAYKHSAQNLYFRRHDRLILKGKSNALQILEMMT